MEQNIEILLEVWKAVKPHLVGGDVESAADDFVHVLMEHGLSADEILTYAIDDELRVALRDFADEESFDDDEEPEDYYDEYDEYEE